MSGQGLGQGLRTASFDLNPVGEMAHILDGLNLIGDRCVSSRGRSGIEPAGDGRGNSTRHIRQLYVDGDFFLRSMQESAHWHLGIILSRSAAETAYRDLN